jgi:hypothetical protein
MSYPSAKVTARSVDLSTESFNSREMDVAAAARRSGCRRGNQLDRYGVRLTMARDEMPYYQPVGHS